MKRRTLIITILAILSSFEITSYGLTINTGTHHDINYVIYEHVTITDSTSGNPTIANLLDGGEIWDDTWVSGNSTFNVHGGFIRFEIETHESSKLNVYSGDINHIWAQGDSSVQIFGGDNIALWAHRNSNTILNGGVLSGIDAQHTSYVEIKDGVVKGQIQAYHHSKVDIYGGEILGNIISGFDGGTHDSIITIYGADFNYDYGAISVDSGVLTGMLSNGDCINNTFHIYDNAQIILAPIPEPATILLLGLGGLVLRRRK